MGEWWNSITDEQKIFLVSLVFGATLSISEINDNITTKDISKLYNYKHTL